MKLSLAEKTLLLLYGTEPEPKEPEQPRGNSAAARATETFTYSRVIGALLMDALLQERIRLKRPALFVQCRKCYLALTTLLLTFGALAILGPAAAAATEILPSVIAVAVSIALLLLLGALLNLILHLFSGRLSVEESPAQDKALDLLLQRMRETGQAKTSYAYFRRLMNFEELREQMEQMRARLVQRGCLVASEVSESTGAKSPPHYTMNPNHPACQELRDQFRAFLLTSGTWNGQHTAALAILLSPRILPKEARTWPRSGWYTSFAPEEYPQLQKRLKAIKTQQDQSIQAQSGAATYRALLTIRNLLPG
ncbi:MAG TPA: hypothetical protein VFU63_12515 [Ktedonobacterales bacterium]|nr:hypothetical protein [Ktedonobacterales bacterium]